MEDKFIKRVQQDISSTKNPVIINNDDSSKGSKNSKYKKDQYKKSRFLDEISDSEEEPDFLKALIDIVSHINLGYYYCFFRSHYGYD